MHSTRQLLVSSGSRSSDHKKRRLSRSDLTAPVPFLPQPRCRSTEPSSLGTFPAKAQCDGDTSQRACTFLRSAQCAYSPPPLSAAPTRCRTRWARPINARDSSPSPHLPCCHMTCVADVRRTRAPSAQTKARACGPSSRLRRSRRCAKYVTRTRQTLQTLFQQISASSRQPVIRTPQETMS